MVEFKEIVSVQSSDEKCFYMEMVYEPASYEEVKDIYDIKEEEWNENDYPKLKLACKPKEVDKSKFVPLREDGVIYEQLITAIKNNATEVDKDYYNLPTIISTSTNIAITTRRGCGNFVIITPEYKEFLKNNEEYKVHVIINDVECKDVLTEVGSIMEGLIKIYQYNGNQLKDEILVGYSAPKIVLDAPIILNIFEDKYQIMETDMAPKYYRIIKRKNNESNPIHS